MLYEVPFVANPQKLTDLRIYPKDKYYAKKGLNFKEYSEFNGICQFGPNQLISCYQYHDDGYSKHDFLSMCKECEYSLNSKKKCCFQHSICEPYFIIEKFDNYIEYDNPKYFIYFISDSEYVKISVSNNIKNRISDLQVSNSRELSLLFLIPVKNKKCAYNLETYLHNIYHRFLVRGEWFDILNLLDLTDFIKVFGKDIINNGNELV